MERTFFHLLAQHLAEAQRMKSSLVENTFSSLKLEVQTCYCPSSHNAKNTFPSVFDTKYLICYFQSLIVWHTDKALKLSRQNMRFFDNCHNAASWGLISPQ